MADELNKVTRTGSAPDAGADKEISVAEDMEIIRKINELQKLNQSEEWIDDYKRVVQLDLDIKALQPCTDEQYCAAMKEALARMQKLLDSFCRSVSMKVAAELGLEEYLDEELKKPEYDGKNLIQILLDEAEAEEEPENSLLEAALRNAKLAKEAAEAITMLQSAGIPKNFLSPNTELANALRAIDGKGELIGCGAQDVRILNKKDTIYVDATLENMDGITLTGKPYTEYDRAVHDAIVSIYENQIENRMPPSMTVDMIYRTMNHKEETEYVSPQQRGAVTKSIEKMRKNIYIYADATTEMQKRGIITNPDGKTDTERHKLILDNFLLSGTHWNNMAAGGSNVSGYIFSEPMLWGYAKLTKQIITVKGDLLDIREVNEKGEITDISIPDTENRISIKYYLLRRIEIIRSDEKKAANALRYYNKKRKKDETLPAKTVSDFRNKNYRTILFDTLFEATEITATNTKTRSRDYVYQVLDYWKAKGNIDGYRKRKKGKTVDAVIIDL